MSQAKVVRTAQDRGEVGGKFVPADDHGWLNVDDVERRLLVLHEFPCCVEGIDFAGRIGEPDVRIWGFDLRDNIVGRKGLVVLCGKEGLGRADGSYR